MIIYHLVLQLILCSAVIEGSSLDDSLNLVTRADNTIGMCRYPGYQLKRVSAMPNQFATLAEAFKECRRRSDCGGVTEWRRKFTLRRSETLEPYSSTISYKACMNATREVRSPENKVEYHFKGKRALKPGDVIEVEASYNEGVPLNIYRVRPSGMVGGNFEIRVSDGEQSVLKVRMELGKGKDAPIEWGKPFKVQIYLISHNSYILYENSVYKGTYETDRPLRSTVTQSISLSGAENKFKWKAIKWPITAKPSSIYTHKDDLKGPLKLLQNLLTSKVSGKSVKDIRAYVSSSEGSIAIFKEDIFDQLTQKETYVDLRDKDVAWIFGNKEALEVLMTSGGKYTEVSNGINYPKINIEAVMRLVRLVKADPSIKRDPTMLRWAVAISLIPRFSNALCDANLKIDNTEMYFNKKEWLKKGIYFPETKTISAWHLKYTLGQSQFKSEIEWAHQNCREVNKSPELMYGTWYMIKYRLVNAAGVRASEGYEKFWNNMPGTLQTIYKNGGACGPVSSFGVAMCRSFGVPAFGVGQPGHLAFVWYDYARGVWDKGNFNKDWDVTTSTSSPGSIGWYAERTLLQEWLPMMTEMQGQHNKNFRLSEKMRLATKFAKSDDEALDILMEALWIEPRNAYTWANLRDVSCKVQKTKRKQVFTKMLGPQFARIKTELESNPPDVALGKPITGPKKEWRRIHSINSPAEAAEINTPDVQFGGSLKSSTMFEVDLKGAFYKFSEVKIQWFNKVTADTIKIFAADQSGRYQQVKTQADVVKKEDGDNAWWTISGWDRRTTKIKVHVSSATRDWRSNRYVGIRNFKLFGLPVVLAKGRLSPKEQLELAIDFGIRDEKANLSFAKTAMKEEFTDKICYE